MIRSALLTGLLAISASAADQATFTPLFNGRDLSGWVNVNCAPETWSVQDGMIHCTGKPTGALRTDRQFENFILELDWRHLSSGGNSGIFIWSSPIAAPGVPFLRAIEVQVLDHGYNASGKNQWYTTHGDVFPIHGSTMKPFGRHNGMRSFPSEERSKPSPEWNHYQIKCDNGVIRLSVNGQEVSGGEDCNYRKGYLGLESEGGPIDFRNIRIQELPPTGASADATAPIDQGWHCLFTGLDLRGWRTNAATAQVWAARDEALKATPAAGIQEAVLWTDQEFDDAEFVLDCRAAKPANADKAARPLVHLGTGEGNGVLIPLQGWEPGETHRFVVTLKGHTVHTTCDGQAPQQISLPPDFPPQRRLGLGLSTGTAEFRNLYQRKL